MLALLPAIVSPSKLTTPHVRTLCCQSNSLQRASPTILRKASVNILMYYRQMTLDVKETTRSVTGWSVLSYLEKGLQSLEFLVPVAFSSALFTLRASHNKSASRVVRLLLEDSSHSRFLKISGRGQYTGRRNGRRVRRPADRTDRGNAHGFWFCYGMYGRESDAFC